VALTFQPCKPQIGHAFKCFQCDKLINISLRISWAGKAITFAPSLAGQSITLTNTLSITKKQLSIQGPRRKITLHIAQRDLEVGAGAVIVITNVIFTSSGATSVPLLTNWGNLTLTDSTISGNISGGSEVEGIDNSSSGTLALINSTISDNNSTDGNINNDGTMSIINSTISNNNSIYGAGGIDNVGILNITGSTISGNISHASDNIYTGSGGISNIRILNITGSTISGNISDKRNGGGIWNNAGTVTLTFCTLYGNRARTGGGLSTEDDTSQTPITHGTSTILNSLVASNQASLGPDIAGKLITKGYNLIQNAKGSVILDPDHKHLPDFFNIPGSQIKIDPDLQLNGSATTMTHALLLGSFAIDAIPPAFCRITVKGVPITTDQRGIKRSQGSACDIGAYEYKS
jgi:hypothetical protein